LNAFFPRFATIGSGIVGLATFVYVFQKGHVKPNHVGAIVIGGTFGVIAWQCFYDLANCMGLSNGKISQRCGFCHQLICDCVCGKKD